MDLHRIPVGSVYCRCACVRVRACVFVYMHASVHVWCAHVEDNGCLFGYQSRKLQKMILIHFFSLYYSRQTENVTYVYSRNSPRCPLPGGYCWKQRLHLGLQPESHAFAHQYFALGTKYLRHLFGDPGCASNSSTQYPSEPLSGAFVERTFACTVHVFRPVPVSSAADDAELFCLDLPDNQSGTIFRSLQTTANCLSSDANQRETVHRGYCISSCTVQYDSILGVLSVRERSCTGRRATKESDLPILLSVFSVFNQSLLGTIHLFAVSQLRHHSIASSE